MVRISQKKSQALAIAATKLKQLFNDHGDDFDIS